MNNDMEFKIELKGNPKDNVENTMATKYTIKSDDIGEVLVDFVEAFLTFSLRNNYGIDEVKDVVDSYYESLEDNEKLSESDKVSERLSEEDKEELEKTIKSVQNEFNLEESQKDIPKMIEDKESRESFLKQINNNELLLKEVFKLYLEDTLSIYE